MNWIFALLLGWHPPLEVPPTPPLDWPGYEESCCDWFRDTFSAYRSWDLNISLSPSREVLHVKATTLIMMPNVRIVLVTPEQMAILESAYPPEQVHCDLDVTFYAPAPDVGTD